jgi:hypothetical protein
MWEPWNPHLPLLTGMAKTTSSANSRESLIAASGRRNAREPRSVFAVHGSASGRLQPAVLFRQLFK